MNITKRVLYRAILTPDGTELASRHRHDFVTHTDTVDNQYYMLDGGLDYARYSMPASTTATWITLTDESPYEEIREKFTRGGRGKHGNEPYSYIALKNMTDGHLAATIAYCNKNHATAYIDIYEEEIKYRKANGISVPDPFDPAEIPLATRIYIKLKLLGEKDSELLTKTNAIIGVIEDWMDEEMIGKVSTIAEGEEPLQAVELEHA